MNKQVLAVVGAVVLAVLGFTALFVYAKGADDRAFEGTELVSVLQVTQEVAAKTPAEDLSASVESVQLPKSAVLPDAVTDLGEVDGLVTRGLLVAGDQLGQSKFAAGDDVEADTTLPKGMQELSITLDSTRVVGGAVVAGDTVGVMASYDQRRVTANPLNEVRVLRVASGLSEDADGAATGAVTVTVAVRTLDAEKIVHAMEFGKVWLTKQNDDTDTDGGRTIDDEDVAP